MTPAGLGLRCMRLLGLAQASASLTLGQLGAVWWPAALLCFALSWVGYVEASERLPRS